MLKPLALIALLTTFSTSAFAQSSAVLGEYSQRTGIRYASEKSSCLSDGGEFEAYGSDDDGMCTNTGPDITNTVTISQIGGTGAIVEIHVIFGAMNMRDFTGVVTKASGSALKVSEAEVGAGGDAKILKDGCEMKVTAKKGSISLAFLNEKCDSDLLRASGASKKVGSN